MYTKAGRLVEAGVLAKEGPGYYRLADAGS
jgi:hypothetical protein